MPDGALAARAAAGEKTIGGAALQAAPPCGRDGHRGLPATLVVAAQPRGTTVRCVRWTGQAWPWAARVTPQREVATRRRAARGRSATGRWQGVRLMPVSR